ncbi:MAG: PAS domain-containing protein, partial [Alphaproteobacteria bacterium]|nr:PAS domain-containing protein [Alphaproteobacteria bacterium]
MQEEGITFEDTFTLKNTNRKMSVYGARINAYDGNLYCDMLWFRDLSEEMIKIEALNVEKNISDSKLETLQNLIDNLNYPVWIRDDTLNIVAINKKYAEFTGQPNKTEIISNQSEFIGVGINNTDTTTAKDLAKLAQQTNKQQKQNINLVVN